MGLCRATFVHGAKRLLRKWKLFVYILLFFVLLQALVALQTNPSLLEEEQARRIEEYRKKKHEQLASEMLQGERSHLARFDKNGLKVEVFNPKDPRFRNQFLQHANTDTKVLEEWEVKDMQNVVNKTSSEAIPMEEIPVEDDGEKTEETFEYKPKCEVTIKDAQSALSRATTNRCKQEIADVACKHQSKSLFPKSMPRYCPHPGKYVFEAPMPSSFDESLKPVRICYILVVHGRALRQFRRLLRLIYRSDHYFYIHVDKRSNYLFREIKKETKKYSNVAVAPWRLATIWGGSSLLQMLLRALTDVLKLWSDWDFFVNLSALDFPIESDEKLVKFLATYRDKNFMKSHGREDEKFIRKQGLNRVFVECDQHMWRLGERDLPEGLTVNGGSDWVALNRPFCEYVIHGNDQLLSDLKHWYRFTLLPAESFFHTLTQNSDKCETFVDNNLRVTNWNRARGCKCQYKHIVDWCGCSPNDFYPSDLGRLQTTRPVFFARKFEEIINQAVVNHLDFKLYGQYPPGTPGLRSYWENCYDHVDGPSSVADAYITYYTSFARMGLKEVNEHLSRKKDHVSQCFLALSKVLEVEIYKYSEDFLGYLVTVEAEWTSGSGTKHQQSDTSSEPVRMQIFVSTPPTLRILDPSSDLAKRLETVTIGTNWDVKELTLRDWGGIIGPESDVHLVARWSRADDDFVVTVVVIDPLNVVNDYNDFRAPARAAGVTETPLSLRKPLRVGRWVVRFYVQRQFSRPCAEVEFVVAPLEFKDGGRGDVRLRTVNRGVADDAQVNAASRNLYSIRTTLNLSRRSSEADKLVLNAQDIEGPGLRSWVDQVVGSAWTVKDHCLVAEKASEWQDRRPDKCRDPRQPRPNLCANANWSSFSPDPKSELGPVKRNGRIR